MTSEAAETTHAIEYPSPWAAVKPQLLAYGALERERPPLRRRGNGSKHERREGVMARLEGAVESEFVRPVHLGATILPFRLMEPWLGVIPRDHNGLLSGDDARLDLYPGLADWWRKAEATWDAHKGPNRLSLVEQIDFHKKLSQQFPTAPHRVLYTKGGQYLAAARLDDPRVPIDHTLYWATVASVDEARYLCAILNSPALTQLVAPLQARGEHNPPPLRQVHLAATDPDL